MQVRTATETDLPQLLDLYRQLNPDDPAMTPAEARENLQRITQIPGSNVYVGCLDHDLVSTCTLIVIPNLTPGGAPYGLIENVVTSALHRKRGYGKAVLSAATSAAWQAGCYKLMLLTSSKDPATLKFYRDAGFEQNKTGFQIRRIPPRG
jgi:GNAT superfamily N-acetyltransferase